MFNDDQRREWPVGSLSVRLPGARPSAESLPRCRLTLVAHRLLSTAFTLHRHRPNVRFCLIMFLCFVWDFWTFYDYSKPSLIRTSHIRNLQYTVKTFKRAKIKKIKFFCQTFNIVDFWLNSSALSFLSDSRMRIPQKWGGMRVVSEFTDTIDSESYSFHPITAIVNSVVCCFSQFRVFTSYSNLLVVNLLLVIQFLFIIYQYALVLFTILICC